MACCSGAVSFDQPGFQGFELLKPADDTRPWLVVTRWDDQESFDAWQHSQNVAHHAHGSHTGERSVVTRAELWDYTPVVDNH